MSLLAVMVLLSCIGFSLLPTVTPGFRTPPSPGQVLYQANWKQGSEDWDVGGQWKIANGMLAADGSSENNLVLLAPTSLATVNYAVEARIQFLRRVDLGDFSTKYGFGILVRSDSAENGYASGSAGDIDNKEVFINLINDGSPSLDLSTHLAWKASKQDTR